MEAKYKSREVWPVTPLRSFTILYETLGTRFTLHFVTYFTIHYKLLIDSRHEGWWYDKASQLTCLPIFNAYLGAANRFSGIPVTLSCLVNWSTHAPLSPFYPTQKSRRNIFPSFFIARTFLRRPRFHPEISLILAINRFINFFLIVSWKKIRKKYAEIRRRDYFIIRWWPNRRNRPCRLLDFDMRQ